MYTAIQVPGFIAITLAIVVFFVGAGINARVPAFRTWNIPDAVTGGLLAALVTLALHASLGLEVNFSLGARDFLLLYFFSGIGLNARLSDLAAGGKPFLILLGLTLAYLVIQNGVAIAGSWVLDLPDGMAVLLGSAALIGGHGTVLAWSPIIGQNFNLVNAAEVGIASATLGLVLASLIGGPIARAIITRDRLDGTPRGAEPVMGLTHEQQKDTRPDIDHMSLMRTVLVLNLVILIAYPIHEAITATGIKLPLFLICMLTAITMTNIVPKLAPRLEWPTRSRALALISDLSLNVFLCMSLMSMQLWALQGLGSALAIVLGAQTVVAAIYILFVVYPLMGRDYDAAVISAGFSGIALGATPTAIANMSAVTKAHGPAPTPFIILPLVSAFFIDIANAVIITFLTTP